MVILIFYMSFLVIRNIQLIGKQQPKQRACPYQMTNHPVEEYELLSMFSLLYRYFNFTN